MLFLLGLQKYFIAGALALAVLSTGTAFVYRSSYLAEHAQRSAMETELRRTAEAMDAAQRLHLQQLESVNRALARSRQIADERTSNRERALSANDSLDGPVAPVLRCAVSGVC